ncbi:MAG: Dabb family protein [Actinomycetota bacterium]
MIHHVVTFRWKEGVDATHVESVATALRRLPSIIPELAGYACGTDLGLAPTNFEFAVTAQFASLEDYLVYRDHPEHQAIIQSLIAPFVSERCAVQFSAS